MGIKSAPQVFAKTPNEVVIKDFEFAGDELSTGETLSAVVSVTITPGGSLTSSNHVVSGTRAQVTLSGGTDGVDYDVLAKVTTSLSQTLEGCGRIQVRTC